MTPPVLQGVFEGLILPLGLGVLWSSVVVSVLPVVPLLGDSWRVPGPAWQGWSYPGDQVSAAAQTEGELGQQGWLGGPWAGGQPGTAQCPLGMGSGSWLSLSRVVAVPQPLHSRGRAVQGGLREFIWVPINGGGRGDAHPGPASPMCFGVTGMSPP